MITPSMMIMRLMTNFDGKISIEKICSAKIQVRIPFSKLGKVLRMIWIANLLTFPPFPTSDTFHIDWWG